MKSRLVIMSYCKHTPLCVAGYTMINKHGILKGYVHDESSNCGRITLLATVVVLEQLSLVDSPPCSIWLETYSRDIADVVCTTRRSGKLKAENIQNSVIVNHDLWLRTLELLEEGGHTLEVSFVSSQRQYDLRGQASEQIEKGLARLGLK